ncbi:MAG TPA: hypothetical protein VN903_32435 [Polyangia bacterium]|jgi:hypothetical protein|nr:hypothetical protein [Polyangia bacterium]
MAATILAPPIRTARAQAGAPALYVFLQLDTKSSILEKTLQARLPGLTVTVFGRFRDFQDAFATKPPAAVLAVSPLLEQEHQKVTLQGVRAGKDWEPYVLVSVGPMKSVDGKTVGIVDLFGHDGTQAFAASLLKTNDVKTKRVAKMEDLLPLIEFSAADGILIPAAGVKRLTERTRLPLAVRELPNGRFGLPAIGIVDPSARDSVVRLIQALDAPTRGLLGVEGWEVK